MMVGEIELVNAVLLDWMVLRFAQDGMLHWSLTLDIHKSSARRKVL